LAFRGPRIVFLARGRLNRTDIRALCTPGCGASPKHNACMRASSYLKLSVAVALATMALKFGAWWLTGSVGPLSDALESLVNLAGASFALLMVAVAAAPPDRDHPYGHHKAEYFAGGFEGLLILAAALVIIWTAIERFMHPRELQSLDIGLALSVLASVLNGALAAAMLRAGRAQRSVALEADARHLFTDVWTTAGVVVALLAVALTGWLWLDPAIAIAVALNILREAVRLLWTAADGLMDRALEHDVQQQIDATLHEFAHQTIRFDHVVTRRAGQRRFVDLHMHLPSSWTLQRAAALRTTVEQALMGAVPGLRARIELLPWDVEAHFNDPEEPPA
jgi:cation diffusion facilitator family transporter